MADNTIRKDENLNKISGGTEVIIDQYRTPAEFPDFDPNKLPKNPGPVVIEDCPIVKRKEIKNILPQNRSAAVIFYLFYLHSFSQYQLQAGNRKDDLLCLTAEMPYHTIGLLIFTNGVIHNEI